jgi:hypothetical protein
VVEAEDFFSVSVCRDLIFHVQEHRMRVAEIAAFLRQNRLTFLGFEFENEDDVLNAYRRRFPGDPAAIDLSNWQAFEEENPRLFSAPICFGSRRQCQPGPEIGTFARVFPPAASVLAFLDKNRDGVSG